MQMAVTTACKTKGLGGNVKISTTISLPGFATAIILLIGLSICSPAAFAQSGAGSIQGTVTDSMGAVIQHASVRVVNQATGVAVHTETNDVGFYQVPGLFTGYYDVTVSAPGMTTYTETLDLLVAQAAVINAVMTTGAVAQQIQVAANAVQLVTTDNGVISSTLENARINQLPMNGRNILTLIGETTPGLAPCNDNGGQPTCANGMMNSATDILVDGVTLINREFGGFVTGRAQMPDPDSIQEVRVETSGVGAQYGLPAVGIMTTKSGTNQFHGTIFETARNNAFGIAKTRQDPADYSAPHYVRNEFGGSIGGPIMVPHVYQGKNKTFFFLDYERFSLASTSYQLQQVPTMAMRSGDWSGLVNSAGVLQQLYDPNTTAPNPACPTPTGGTVNSQWCRQPFKDNQIPISRLSPTAAVIYAITPKPTNDANPLLEANYNAPDPVYTIAPDYTFRLDQAFDENTHAYLRFTHIPYNPNTSLRNQPSDEPATVAATVNGFNYPADASGVTNESDQMYASALGVMHAFSPSLFSETIASLQNAREFNGAAGSPNIDFEAKMGLPNNFGETGFPYFDSALAPLSGTMYSFGLDQTIETLNENLAKTIGKHQIDLGGAYRRERFTYYANRGVDSIDFEAGATALENPATDAGNTYSGFSNTGYADADEFLGAALSYTVTAEPPNLHFHDTEVDGYLQDNYHAAKHFTLNLGLRYESHPAPVVNDGLMTGFDMKNDALVLGTSTANLIAKGYTTQAIINNIGVDGGKIESYRAAGLSATMLKSYDFNLLPRVGFAWQPISDWGTVIRGAYGLYIFPTNLYYSIVTGSTKLPYEGSYTQSYTSASQSPDGLPNYLLRAPQTTAAAGSGTPVMGVNTTSVVNTGSDTSILPGINTYSVDPDFAPSRATQTNFTIEQPIKGWSALRLSWIYSHGSNLQQFYYYNQHPSTYAYEIRTGVAPPNGGPATIGTNQYSLTATGPYDQITWGGGSYRDLKSGWSNYNALQVAYQRLYHRGIAWQIDYTFGKQLDTGQQGTNGEIHPTGDFANSGLGTMTSPYGTVVAPNPAPSEPVGAPSWQYFKALNRFENYMEDGDSPRSEIQFNGIVDLPVGRGKWLLGNAGRLANELVGGWQLAGDGNIVSQTFTITSSNWGPTNPLHVYKHKVPITDCRSGVCIHKYEWFNGYIAPTAVAGVDCATNCVIGLPPSWEPYQTPIDDTPGTQYYGANEVNITLANGKTSPISYSPGPQGANPFSKTVLNGPFNWTADASLFKVFPVTNDVSLRFNMDVFNVFNVQGETNPNATDGTQEFTSSYNSARQMQLTARLTF